MILIILDILINEIIVCVELILVLIIIKFSREKTKMINN